MTAKRGLNPPLLLDGGTGTNLYAAGMPGGVCVEDWVLAHPETMLSLQRGYVDAGCDALMAPTFGANRAALAHFGHAEDVAEYNRRLVALSVQAADGRALVAGDMSPTGLFIEPYGDGTFRELVEIYAEQARALKDAGADYIAIETITGLADARAALLAARQTGLPVAVTFTVDDNGRLLSGGDARACLVTLAAMGADAVGLNCSTGPQVILRSLRGLRALVDTPLIAKPNAGLPHDNVYELDPTAFVGQMQPFFAEGVGILGGCCGTTPAHMAALRKAMDAAALPEPDEVACGAAPVAAGEKAIYGPAAEYDTPARELACNDELEDELFDLEPGERSCVLIRVKTAEEARVFGRCAFAAQLPVRLLADSADALEEALALYQGRAFIDPRSAVEQSELDRLVKTYGAVPA